MFNGLPVGQAETNTSHLAEVIPVPTPRVPILLKIKASVLNVIPESEVHI